MIWFEIRVAFALSNRVDVSCLEQTYLLSLIVYVMGHWDLKFNIEMIKAGVEGLVQRIRAISLSRLL